MKIKQQKIMNLLLLFFYVLIAVVVILVILFNRTETTEEMIYSINVRGYNLDYSFDPDLYEYNVVVTDNIVEISCNSSRDIEGCNVRLDLTDKKKYSHVIKVNKGKKTIEYVINITNETVIEDTDFYIKEVKGNTFDWTNEDICLEVIISNAGNYLYSFDGGQTWQDSNKFSVSQNGIFQIVAKNSDEKLTNVKTVEVDRIDKAKPQVTINKLNMSNSKVTLEVIAYDSLSGIAFIRFNGGDFSQATTYDVSKPGNYYIEVKDYAGNITDKLYIEITEEDFKKETPKDKEDSEEPKVKIYTLTLKGNGASLEKKSVSCTTTGDSCQVILPRIITTHTALGWSLDRNATEATYPSGTTIELNDNLTLYAITKKEYTATFYQNGANSIGSGSLTCTAYNEQKCEITTPSITSTGTVIGWGSSSNSTTTNLGVNQTVELNGNVSYYAITKREHTATFHQNGATSIGSNRLSCTAYNLGKCEITTPNITTTGSVIGWGSNSSATTSTYGINQKIELNNDVNLYAITKRTFTATFASEGLSYLSASSLSCSVYNTDSSCEIILPYFNKLGHFNSFWSTNSEVSSNLSGTKWSWAYFNQVGHPYTLTENVTLYPNFNQFHYDLTKNCYKYRSFSVSTTKFIGNTLFEFESGIPQIAINNFMTSMNQAYSLMPWLFTPGKVFVMTESTYSNYSTAYGLTHQMYKAYGGDSYFTVDLKYDTSGAVVKNAIDINAALHELAHGWDSYYYFRTGSGIISDTSDFVNFYNSIGSKLYVDANGKTISTVETFAGMVTNYYWHVLGIDRSKSHYALKSGYTLNSTELSQLQTFMQKYINISNSGY